jgi:alpha-glucosidase
VARRSGQDWFVGSMTDEHDETLSIPLQFLAPHTLYVANPAGL